MGKAVRQLLIVADEYQGAAMGFGLVKQQIEEAVTVVGIERRGWLVSEKDLRAADQCSGNGGPLLLTNAQLHYRRRVQVVAEIQRSQQAPGCGLGTTASSGSLGFPRGEGTRQGYVLQGRQIRKEVELLENDAHMVGSEPITST